jgi:hypothetical protein
VDGLEQCGSVIKVAMYSSVSLGAVARGQGREWEVLLSVMMHVLSGCVIILISMSIPT